jgi:hypothetical protein
MEHQYIFRVDLQSNGETLHSNQEALALANAKTLYLPISGGGLPIRKLKHGDTFVVSGVTGSRLKRLIDQQRITNIVLDTPVEEENEEETTTFLLGVSEEGIYSMRLTGDKLTIGGKVYVWSEMQLPNGSFNNLNDPLMASDGTNVYVLWSSYDDGASTLLKIEPDGSVSTIDTSELPTNLIQSSESMTYVGDDKLAIIANNTYILCNTSGELLLTLEQFSYQGYREIVYFQDQLYGFGNGNVLVTINKDTGELLYNEDIQQKISRTLSWVEGSLEYEINGMFEPFVANGRLFAKVFPNNVDIYNERLVEVFPDTNEINHISFFDIDLGYIVECEFSEDLSLETGFSIQEFDEDNYEFEAFFYNGEIWAMSLCSLSIRHWKIWYSNGATSSCCLMRAIQTGRHWKLRVLVSMKIIIAGSLPILTRSRDTQWS